MRYTSLLLLLLIAVPTVVAQQPEQQAAEQRLRELRTQIDRYQQELRTVRSDEASAVEALRTIDREIATREELIRTYQRRHTELRTETIAIENEIQSLRREMDRLREEYAQYARQAYLRGRVGDLALILSAGSINEMLIRARYLERLSAQRREAAAQITRNQRQLTERLIQLEANTIEIEGNLAETRAEQSQLAVRQRERSEMVAQLRRRGISIEQEVQRREQEASQLESTIQRLIAEAEAERRRLADEARRRQEEADRLAAERAAAERRGETPPPARPADPRPAPPTPTISEAEFRRLSGSFRQNQGRIPWPLNGVVTERFGNRTNPITGTITNTPGIVISAGPATPVRAVFSGEVARIAVIPEWGTYVIVSHGDYQTVYGNLSGVSVSRGQRVEAGGTIGLSGTLSEPQGAALFFAVFGNGGALDPARWLAPR